MRMICLSNSNQFVIDTIVQSLGAIEPPRHRFLEPIHNVKEGANPLYPRLESREDLVFIPGKMEEPIGI